MSRLMNGSSGSNGFKMGRVNSTLILGGIFGFLAFVALVVNMRSNSRSGNSGFQFKSPPPTTLQTTPVPSPNPASGPRPGEINPNVPSPAPNLNGKNPIKLSELEPMVEGFQKISPLAPATLNYFDYTQLPKVFAPNPTTGKIEIVPPVEIPVEITPGDEAPLYHLSGLLLGGLKKYALVQVTSRELNRLESWAVIQANASDSFSTSIQKDKISLMEEGAFFDKEKEIMVESVGPEGITIKKGEKRDPFSLEKEESLSLKLSLLNKTKLINP